MNLFSAEQRRVMTEEDIIRSIERIVRDEPSDADAVLKLKSSQRTDLDTPGRGGGRIALFVVAAGLAAVGLIVPLTDHHTMPVKTPAVQRIPAAAPPPRVVTTERPSPKAYAVVLPAKPARSTVSKPDAEPPSDNRGPAPSADPAIAKPLTGEALRLALIEDARRTRELNQKELTNLHETAPR